MVCTSTCRRRARTPSSCSKKERLRGWRGLFFVLRLEHTPPYPNALFRPGSDLRVESFLGRCVNGLDPFLALLRCLWAFNVRSPCVNTPLRVMQKLACVALYDYLFRALRVLHRCPDALWCCYHVHLTMVSTSHALPSVFTHECDGREVFQEFISEHDACDCDGRV